MSESHVVLWNPSLNRMLCQPLEAWLSENRQAYRDGAQPTHLMPMFVGSKSTCTDAAETVNRCREWADKPASQHAA